MEQLDAILPFATGLLIGYILMHLAIWISNQFDKN